MYKCDNLPVSIQFVLQRSNISVWKYYISTGSFSKYISFVVTLYTIKFSVTFLFEMNVGFNRSIIIQASPEF